MGDKKKKEKNPETDAIATVWEKNDNFLKWRLEIEGRKIETASLDVRMQHMLAGLMMGIAETTLLPLCGLTAADTQKWLDISPDNLHEFQKARKYSDAQLEFVVQQASLYDPRLAIRVLEKRDPDRWKKSNFNSFKKGVSKGISMSNALERGNKNAFDVTL